jgi:putative hydrolase of the HAD superfamily
LSLTDMIFFDVDGTLLDDQTAVAHGLDALHASYGATIGLSRDALTHVWQQLLDRHFARYLAGDVSMTEQRRARMRDLFGGGGSALSDERDDAAFAMYLGGYEAGWTPYPDVGETLAQLTDRRLGVITNGDRGQQLKKLERTGLAPFFSVVLTSDECGVAKPAARIFVEACRRADVATTSATYVGDDWAKDVIGSREAGLQPIWLRRESSASQETLPGIPVVETLVDLPAALAALGATTPGTPD